MEFGMVGTDIMHACEYASIINCTDSNDFPMISMRPLDHRMESRIAKVRNESIVEVPQQLTGADLRRDETFASARVVSWWSDDLSAAKLAADRTAVPEVANTLNDLIEQTEAIFVCTKNADTHYAIAMTAILAGRHVFVDKPFVSSYREAVSLVEAAETAGVIVASSSPWRWTPIVQKLKAQLSVVGEIRSIVCSAPAIDGSFYLAHSADVIDELVGPGATAIELLHGRLYDTIVVDYGCHTRGLINGMREIAWLRHVAIFGENGYIEGEITNRQRDYGKIELVRRFVNGVARKDAPIDSQRMLDVMRMITARQRV